MLLELIRYQAVRHLGQLSELLLRESHHLNDERDLSEHVLQV